MTDETKTKRSLRKTRIGTVVSDRPNKTVVVRVERRSLHPLYKKVVTHSSRCYAHDENNEAKPGDRVEIMETRPLSKLKRWRLIAILQRAVKA